VAGNRPPGSSVIIFCQVISWTQSAPKSSWLVHGVLAWPLIELLAKVTVRAVDV